jgi:recombination protein RecA
MFSIGISKQGDLLDLGVAMELIRKSGANYSFQETKLGQGRENAKEFLLKNPEIMLEIERQVRAAHAGTDEPSKAKDSEKPELEQVGAASPE